MAGIDITLEEGLDFESSDWKYLTDVIEFNLGYSTTAIVLELNMSQC